MQTRGSGSTSPTTCCRSPGRRRRAGTTHASSRTGRSHSIPPLGAALRTGDLRRAEGVPPRRRLDLDIPAARPTPQRFQRSARRLALPELPVDEFVESIEALVKIDADWVPSGGRAVLYLRPFMFATEVFLGVRPSAEVRYMVIASPVGSYFAERREAGEHLAVLELHPRCSRRDGCGEVRWQLRGRPRRAARSDGARLRSGVLPRCRGAPLGRGTRRNEPLLRARPTVNSSRRRRAGRSSKA